MKPITDEQAAYLAGFIDGEGWVGVARNQRAKIDGVITCNYYVGVCIVNTNLVQLEWIKELLGLGQIAVNGHGSVRHKVKYQLNFRVDEIKPVLERIQKYLRIKQEQSELVLEFLQTIRPSGFGQSPLTDDEKRLKEIIFEQLADLNKRGP